MLRMPRFTRLGRVLCQAIAVAGATVCGGCISPATVISVDSDVQAIQTSGVASATNLDVPEEAPPSEQLPAVDHAPEQPIIDSRKLPESVQSVFSIPRTPLTIAQIET